ncbi:MAG: C1 family peptidase, partial [Gemmatimonadota bacterium]|nr:C1 family peptidase [Gemmatimonadota bacterium]
MESGPKVFTGWTPEPADSRDHGPQSPAVKALLVRKRAGAGKTTKPPPIPKRVDLREWCPSPKLQGNFNTCAAHVVAALVEYFERRSFGKSIAPSRRFLFRVAKNLAEAKGSPQNGIYIRQAMGALKMIGSPPEKFFPYPDVADPAAAAAFDEEPSAFCYALASDYRAVTYYRLDTQDADGTPSTKPVELLEMIKRHLAANIPTTIGFPLYGDIIKGSMTNGELPYPPSGDQKLGSHAVTVAGYDDEKTFASATDKSERGALLILNSWGEKW